MLLFGIIGHPLGHSMSPALHNWAFGQLGIPGEYRAFPTPPEELPAFMRRMRELPISGLSVTIPHKVAILQHLDVVSTRVQAVGAANTLYWDRKRLLGENTDIHGFLTPLKELAAAPASALVLGAGGAARAVVAGLLELGTAPVTVTNRNAAKAEALAAEFGVRALPWESRTAAEAALIVNTTPLGMRGDRQDLSPWPAAAGLTPDQIAYDLVYNPTATRFLAHAEGCGCRTIDGLTMVVHQAVEQFRLWTGQSFDIREARALIVKLLN